MKSKNKKDYFILINNWNLFDISNINNLRIKDCLRIQIIIKKMLFLKIYNN